MNHILLLLKTKLFSIIIDQQHMKNHGFQLLSINTYEKQLFSVMIYQKRMKIKQWVLNYYLSKTYRKIVFNYYRLKTYEKQLFSILIDQKHMKNRWFFNY